MVESCFLFACNPFFYSELINIDFVCTSKVALKVKIVSITVQSFGNILPYNENIDSSTLYCVCHVLNSDILLKHQRNLYNVSPILKAFNFSITFV